jgi:hypothetical protein
MADDYNKELCEERHKDIRDNVKTLFDRMRTLELRVAGIVAIGVLLNFFKDAIFPGPKVQAAPTHYTNENK